MNANLARAPEILVVGGEPADMDMLARRLSLRRLQAKTVRELADALVHLRDNPPDVILANISADDPSGTDFLLDVRRRHTRAEIPIIALTRQDDRQAMIESVRDGANDFMTTPVDFEILLARISAQLGVRSEFRRALTERARLQRRLETRARLEDKGYGDPQRRVFLMNEMHRGLGEGHFSLHYQPQLCIRSNEIESVESLVRWKSPTLGEVPPDHFVPLAEETGDIAALTDWVVTQAVADHQTMAAAGHKVRIAINLSAVLAGDVEFVEHLLQLLEPHAHAVSLELTESAIFENPEQAIENLRKFAEAGLRIAIDDYGTGMSSLSYIQRLPVQELKIDRMFISNLTKSHRDPLLVRSTIELAHALDFEVVAEGVENAQTLALLSAMGCDFAQGYHVGKPMSAIELPTFLADSGRKLQLTTHFDAEAFLRECLADSAA